MLPLLVFTGALVCLANLAGLGLFILAFRRQLAGQRESLNTTRDDFQQAINQILDRYQSLREQVDQERTREERPDFQTVATSPSFPHLQTGMNLTKRVQILRLHRRGETASSIASSLGTPQAEVELVIKLHATAPALR